jgi:peptidoglycan L-alanyl-D-glutamate endopeptidase CwlK
VTNAPAGSSLHNYGVAFDIGIFRNGQYLDNSPIDDALGVLGKTMSLEWGGDFKRITDKPHFQMRGMSLDTLRARHNAGVDVVTGI